MAKIKAMNLFQLISGKMGQNERYYFSYSSKTGRITMKRCPEHGPTDSAAARRNRERFVRAAALAKEWLDQNRPGRLGDPNLDGTLEYYKMRCAFDRQSQNASFFAYVCGSMLKRLKQEEEVAGTSGSRA